MSLFDYQDYKQYFNDWVRGQPHGGHGQFRRLALHLGVNSVVVSQIFRGDRELTLEQALGVTHFLSMTEIERDYFLLLVQKARAGSHGLRSVFEAQLESMRATAQALKSRIKHQKFKDEDRATFYSHWYYSAVRLGVSIPRLGTVSEVADYLHLDRTLVSRVVEFLMAHRLIVEKNGRLDIGPQVTHIGHDSPFVFRHHSNWRLKALQAMEKAREGDLFYTGPMALSKNVADEIRASIVDLVELSTKNAADSDSEVLRCLTIDWFGVGHS